MATDIGRHVFCKPKVGSSILSTGTRNTHTRWLSVQSTKSAWTATGSGFSCLKNDHACAGLPLERFRVAPLESRFSGMESNSMSDASIAPTADQNVPARFTCRFRCVWFRVPLSWWRWSSRFLLADLVLDMGFDPGGRDSVGSW